MRYLLFCSVILITNLAPAQDGYPILSAINATETPLDTPGVDTMMTSREGDVKIVVTPRIEGLLKDYASRKHTLNGYRVQIFLGDRNTAESTKRTFLQKHPDLPAYLSWLAPNFRLRVGDMNTRLEAEHLLRELRVTYPGSYIVPDEVEMGRD